MLWLCSLTSFDSWIALQYRRNTEALFYGLIVRCELNVSYEVGGIFSCLPKFKHAKDVFYGNDFQIHHLVCELPILFMTNFCELTLYWQFCTLSLFGARCMWSEIRKSIEYCLFYGIFIQRATEGINHRKYYSELPYCCCIYIIAVGHFHMLLCFILCLHRCAYYLFYYIF